MKGHRANGRLWRLEDFFGDSQVLAFDIKRISLGLYERRELVATLWLLFWPGSLEPSSNESYPFSFSFKGLGAFRNKYGFVKINLIC